MPRNYGMPNPEAPLDDLDDHWGTPPPDNSGWWMTVLLAVTVVLSLLGFVAYAFAHDHARPDLNAWYESLSNGNGTPCCDSTEATRIQDVDWQSSCKDAKCHYQVFIAKQWWDVPDWAIVNAPNQSGATLVWPIYYWNDGKPENGLSSVFIRCFMPGAGG
jgi:hypothetical protein